MQLYVSLAALWGSESDYNYPQAVHQVWRAQLSHKSLPVRGIGLGGAARFYSSPRTCLLGKKLGGREPARRGARPPGVRRGRARSPPLRGCPASAVSGARPARSRRGAHHERRRSGLLRMAPQVTPGEKVEALCK